MRFTSRGLRVRYPAQDRWAVDGINLDIAPGQVTWLTGALGSGTSTLLLALAGLSPRLTGGDREGTVLLDDADMALATPLSRDVAYLGPSPSLQISGVAKTVRDEIAVGPINLGRPREAIVFAVSRAMQLLRLEHLGTRAPDTLSSGETQRMLVAALLAASPRAWLLDEPFSALDHATTGHMQQLFRAQAASGATVVIACDDADAMLDLADRMIVMRDGRIVLDGDPRQVLAGNAITVTGAGTTDAATLASDAGFDPPRPLTRAELFQRIARRPGVLGAPMVRPVDATAPLAAVAVDLAVATSDEPRRPARAMPALQMRRVRFAYEVANPVLNDVTLDVWPGEAVGLFGANGTGKSTLLRLAMALEHPMTGSVTTLGAPTDGRHPEDFAPAAGFLFQQPERQLFAASVRSECSLAPRLAGWDPARVDAGVATVLDELGLSDTAMEHPYDLPLPRRRLVALAAILAADPDLILLDEPTAALDFASRETVIRVVRERVRRGRAVLAITHDATFAHEALQRGLVLEHGQVVHDGPIRSVIDDARMKQPAALAVALALGLPPGSDRRAAVACTLRSR